MLRIRRRVLTAVCALVATILAAPAVAVAGNNQNPRAVDPQTHKARYQTLSAEWWQWVFSTAINAGPFDAGRVRCAVNQPESSVLFLAGGVNSSGTVDRTCTDPVGQTTQIFFPVINTECSNQEGPPFYGGTPGKRKECVNDPLFNPAGLSATVDGQPFPVSEARFNIVSNDFSFTCDPNNPGIPGCVSGQSTSRGTWLLIEPLQKGSHTFKFAGSYPNVPFSLSVTYRLTVR
jgi:hypothetical protein